MKFMEKCKLDGGIRKLVFWEQVETLFLYKKSPGGGSPHTYNKEIKKIQVKAQKIDEFDINTMQILETLAQKPETDKDDVDKVLIKLKAETAKHLRREYAAFQEHFVGS